MSNGRRSLNKFFSTNQFIGSFKNVKNLPASNNSFECCFVGRSNVGKSSIINAITKNKKLAKTSKTPGFELWKFKKHVKSQGFDPWELQACF